MNHHEFMQKALDIANENMNRKNGRPFGAVIVKDGQVIGTGTNEILAWNDPTAHAEMLAIRDACKHQASIRLDGCILYASGEPCPMCLSAIYWAGIKEVYYANPAIERSGVSTPYLYQQLSLPSEQRDVQVEQLDMGEEAQKILTAWQQMNTPK